MGVVWLAEDTTLDRKVALKFLASNLVGDGELRKRFQREAKAAAGLSHPNICTVHEIDEAEGKPFLVAEYIDGDSLEAKIEQGPLKLNEALDIGRQIAEGVQSAHSKGIVRRDIKPGNILITSDGRLKILDFGLALLTEGSKITKLDTTVGTVAYMSPEQAQGAEVDHRTDLWALGVVIYEMVSGERPFPGVHDQALLYEIVNEEPEPLTAVRAGVPMELELLVAKCLSKDTRNRYQSARELIVDLRNVEERLKSGRSKVVHTQAVSTSDGVEADDATPEPSQRSFVWPVIAAAAIVAAILGWWPRTGTTDSPHTPHHNLIQLTFDGGLTYQPAISPDGNFISYASDRAGEGNLDIWIQQIGGEGDPIRLTDNPADDEEPDFSPDGQTIAFHSLRDGGGVYVIPTLGGQEKLIAQPGNRPKFSPDGSWIAYSVGPRTGLSNFGASPSGQVHIVSPTGLSPSVIAEDFQYARTPVWLDNDSLLFDGRRSTDDTTVWGWWISSLEGKVTQSFDNLESIAAFAHPLGIPRPQLATIQGEHAVFTLPEFNSQNLWRMRIEWSSGRVVGSAERLTFGSGQNVGADADDSGRIVFANLDRQIDIWSLPLDSESGRVGAEPGRLTDDPASKGWPTVSRDGSRVVFVTDRAGSQDVVALGPEFRKHTTVAGSGVSEGWPVLNSNGTKALYTVIASEDDWRMDVTPLDGGVPRTLAPFRGRLDDWSSDELNVLFRGADGITSYDVSSGREKLLIDGQGEPQLFQPRFSPDGKWIVFRKRGVSREQLFVARIDGNTPVPEEDWIGIYDESVWVGKCRWGTGGSIIYYVSEKDGFRCIWGQRLEPETKQPLGEPFSLYHSHDPSLSIFNVDLGPQEISVARDKIIFNMAEITGNVWMLEPVE